MLRALPVEHLTATAEPPMYLDPLGSRRMDGKHADLVLEARGAQHANDYRRQCDGFEGVA
jgi:hypothetical protein